MMIYPLCVREGDDCAHKQEDGVCGLKLPAIIWDEYGYVCEDYVENDYGIGDYMYETQRDIEREYEEFGRPH